MPNWPMRLAASLPASSAASLSRKARVPERAIVPSASTSSSRLMPTPLSLKADRLGVGIDGDLNGERPAGLDQLGLGDRLVAQLLARVGGVGDELANENVAIRVDGMDHEMQQPRNVGLEALRFRVVARREGDVRGQIRLVKKRKPRAGPRQARRRRTYRRKDGRFQVAPRECRPRQKKADRLGGGPPIR